MLWPGARTGEPVRSKFRRKWEHALYYLNHELAELEATEVFIELDVDQRHLRMDGGVRADAKPRSAAVILSFQTKRYGPMRYPCDTFDDWKHNVYAIALSLNALRMVNRFGVSRHGEQYRGWGELPAPLVTAPPMSLEDAVRVIAEGAGLELADVVLDWQGAFRLAANEVHPDKPDGDAEEFKRLMQAREVLEKEGPP